MNICESITKNFKKVIVPEKGGWSVYSHDKSKRLGGPYTSRSQAAKRLRQVEYFKHTNKVQKMARKKAIYEGPWREGERPPKGMIRGDIFRDDKGNMWGVVGRGSEKRIVSAWKVPHYTPSKNIPRKIPHGESFVGPDGKVHTVIGDKLVPSGRPYHRAPGPKHKRKIKFTREDKELLHAAKFESLPKNISRKWSPEMKAHKKFLREKAASYEKWKGSLPVRLARPAKYVRNIGLGALAGWGAYKLAQRAARARQRRLESSEKVAKAMPYKKFVRGRTIGYAASVPPGFVNIRHIEDTDVKRVNLIGNRLFAQNIESGKILRVPVDNETAVLWWKGKIGWGDVLKPMKKSIGFINDLGYYQTYDEKGNVVFLKPEDGRAMEKGEKSRNQAYVDTLCSIVHDGMVSDHLEKSHGERSML